MTDNKTAWEERRRAERINALSAIRGLASDLFEMMKKRSITNYKWPKGKILGYRTANAAGQAHGGFQWIEGWNEAPDWNPEPVCGGGLHFLKWGEGASGLLDWTDSATHWIVEADESETVTMDDKAKARRVYAWKFDSRQSALEFLLQIRPESVVHGISHHAGDESTQTAGYRSTQTAGNESTQTAGDYSTFTGGIGTVQICRYYNNDWKASVQIVGENGVEPNLPYVCRQGVWTRKDGER
ncbi:MAG: hypothetical protein E6Q97_39350 [Desulfurellales bacterium]|nr:MAG: hypothetical protein E6Q97_39350 [Desulfurellales bacterium]